MKKRRSQSRCHDAKEKHYEKKRLDPHIIPTSTRKKDKRNPQRVASLSKPLQRRATTSFRGKHNLRMFPPIHEVPVRMTMQVFTVHQSFAKQCSSSDRARPSTFESRPPIPQTFASFAVETYELQEYCVLASWRQCRFDLQQ